MDEEEKYKLLLEKIRNDLDYYQERYISAETRSSIILTFAGVILTVLLFFFFENKDVFMQNIYFTILLTLILGTLMISSFFSILCIIPISSRAKFEGYNMLDRYNQCKQARYSLRGGGWYRYKLPQLEEVLTDEFKVRQYVRLEDMSYERLARAELYKYIGFRIRATLRGLMSEIAGYTLMAAMVLITIYGFMWMVS